MGQVFRARSDATPPAPKIYLAETNPGGQSNASKPAHNRCRPRIESQVPLFGGMNGPSGATNTGRHREIYCYIPLGDLVLHIFHRLTRARAYLQPTKPSSEIDISHSVDSEVLSHTVVRLFKARKSQTRLCWMADTSEVALPPVGR